jgi:hypothetical protein
MIEMPMGAEDPSRPQLQLVQPGIDEVSIESRVDDDAFSRRICLADVAVGRKAAIGDTPDGPFGCMLRII